MQHNTITTSDALTFLKQLADASVPMFLFSPPYNLGNSSGGGMPGAKKTGHYPDSAGLGRRGGPRPLRRGMGRRVGKWSGGALADGYDDFSDGMPWSEYIPWQQQILAECWRCLPENGAIFYNHKERVLDGVLLDPMVFVPDCCYLRQRIIWARAGGINFSPSFFCPTHEVILVLAKSGFRLKSKGASGAGTVWYIPQETSTWHPAPFPMELAMRALETTMPTLICDPFSGSGTVAKAAKRLGIDFLGCDRNAAYVERANQELSKERRMTVRQKTMADVIEEQGVLL
jgi:site-specific DNA-methyltransferase (adenine-specific)